MTMSRKTGRRYEKKMQRLIRETFPDVSDADLTGISARVMGAKTFIATTLCTVSIADVDSYTEVDMYPQKKDGQGTRRVGYCETHQTLHRYPRQTLTRLVNAERDAVITHVRALGDNTRLPLDLWDMLNNRYCSLLDMMISKHEDDVAKARLVYAYKQRRTLADQYEQMPLTTKLDFYFCGRKSPRDTYAEAAASLRDQPAPPPGDGELVVYQCEWCNKYHLAHKDKHNDYTGATDEQMTAYASYTWYNQYANARKYAVRQGWQLDVTVTQADLALADTVAREPVFSAK